VEEIKQEPVAEVKEEAKVEEKKEEPVLITTRTEKIEEKIQQNLPSSQIITDEEQRKKAQ
jgi:hypothetical protein